MLCLWSIVWVFMLGNTSSLLQVQLVYISQYNRKFGSFSKLKCRFTLSGHLHVHTVYKHFHAEILYTKSLEVLRVLALMHTVCSLSQDWCSQHLEFDYGHRKKAKSDMCVFCAVVCENIFPPTSTDSYQPTDPTLTCILPDTHTRTHSHTCEHTACTCTHTHASFILKPSLTYQSAYHVNSCDMVRLGGWFIFSKSSSHNTAETLKVPDRNSIKKIMK